MSCMGMAHSSTSMGPMWGTVRRCPSARFTSRCSSSRSCSCSWMAMCSGMQRCTAPGGWGWRAERCHESSQSYQVNDTKLHVMLALAGEVYTNHYLLRAILSWQQY